MITCEKCKLGIQNSIIECLINDGKKELEIELKKSINSLKEYISNLFNYDELNNDLSANEIYKLKFDLNGFNFNSYKYERPFLFENFQKIILISFKDLSQKLIYLNQNTLLSEESNKILLYIINNILKLIKSNVEENYEKIFDKQGDKLAKKYLYLVSEIDAKRNTCLGTKKNLIFLENKSVNELKNLLKNEVLEYIYIKILQNLFDKFSEEFIIQILQNYDNLIEDEDFFDIFIKKGIKDTEETYIRIKNLINIENDENISEDDDEKNDIRSKIYKKLKGEQKQK